MSGYSFLNNSQVKRVIINLEKQGFKFVNWTKDGYDDPSKVEVTYNDKNFIISLNGKKEMTVSEVDGFNYTHHNTIGDIKETVAKIKELAA